MKLSVFSALVGLGLLLPLDASADTSATTDARHRYAQGAAAFSKGDFAAAVDAFADVYRITGETKHLWNLALAESQAGRPFDALTHLRLYVSKPDAKPQNVERARGLIAEASAHVGHVTVLAPEGADILLDGARVGAAPLAAALDVDPGIPHAIVAQKGSDTAKQSLPPTGASSVRVALSFPVPPPVAPIPVAAAPSAPMDAAPPVASAPLTSQGDGSSLRTWVTVGLGVGALAALGGGVAMGIVSTNDANGGQQLIAGMPQGACANPAAAGCAQLAQNRSAEDGAHGASIALYTGAAVLGAGALAAFLFLPHGHHQETRGAMIPLVAPGVVGAGYTGAF